MLKYQLLVLTLWIAGCLCIIGVRQERAVVEYYNPKYISYAQAFTSRVSRKEPYKTNITSTIIYPWGNNVTCSVQTYLKQLGENITFEIKTCDIRKHDWVHSFLKTYSNLHLDQCPLEPGKYEFLNLEMPPKNYPFLVLKGTTEVTIICFLTSTKETLFKLIMKVHVT